jgi:hypothetical protein
MIDAIAPPVVGSVHVNVRLLDVELDSARLVTAPGAWSEVLIPALPAAPVGATRDRGNRPFLGI